MAEYKCKSCGAPLDVVENQDIIQCDFCGVTQTLPKFIDNRIVNLMDRANYFRRNNEYDKAISIFEKILIENSSDPEIYWSLILCKYGIEYVEDPTSKVRKPTINRMQATSIYADEYYKLALQYSSLSQRLVIENEAKEIDRIQREISAISQQEDPFDIFICYKETDNNGKRTHDSVLANDLYYQLTQEGYRVFFAKITLEDKLGTAYEPYIFAALNSAKVMVVLGTKPEYFNAVWVKNEWSRFLSLIKQGQKKILIPAYRDMDPYELPEEFSHLQAQDMSKLGFMQDLIRGIKKINPLEDKNAVVHTTNIINNSANQQVEPLLKRIKMFIDDKEFDNASAYVEKVLDINPECGEAYFYSGLIELKSIDEEDLKRKLKEDVLSYKDFKKAYTFGDSNLKERIDKIIQFQSNSKTIESYIIAEDYDTALDLMKKCGNNFSYRKLISPIGKNNQITLLNYILDNFKIEKEELNHMLCLASSVNFSIDSISLIIDAGADVNAIDVNSQEVNNNTKFSPLNMACFKPNLNIVKFLLSKGANPNTPNPSGSDTLLSYSLSMEKYDIALELIKYGADINVKFKDMDLLTYAYSIHNYNLMTEILKRQQNHPNISEIVKKVIDDNQISIFKEILKAGINPNIQIASEYKLNDSETAKNASALFYCAFHDKMSYFYDLVNAGANVNVRISTNSITIPLLNYLIFKHDYNAVKFLIDKGVNLNSQRIIQYSSTTSAKLSALSDSLNVFFDKQIAKLLIESGADVNMADYDKAIVYPITHSIIKKDVELVKLLLSKGANPNSERVILSSSHSYSVLNDSIQQWKNNEIAKLLIEAGADINYVQNSNSKKGDQSVSRSILSVAVAEKNAEILKVLLEKGADLSYGKYEWEYDKKTSLLYDCLFNFPNDEIVNLLLDYTKQNDIPEDILTKKIPKSKEFSKETIKRLKNIGCKFPLF